MKIFGMPFWKAIFGCRKMKVPIALWCSALSPSENIVCIVFSLSNNKLYYSFLLLKTPICYDVKALVYLTFLHNGGSGISI